MQHFVTVLVNTLNLVQSAAVSLHNLSCGIKIKSYLNFTARLMKIEKNVISQTAVFQEFTVPEMRRGFLWVGVDSH